MSKFCPDCGTTYDELGAGHPQAVCLATVRRTIGRLKYQIGLWERVEKKVEADLTSQEKENIL